MFNNAPPVLLFLLQLEKFLQVLDLSHAVMLLALRTVRCIVVEVLR